jgi:hypothetical protein
MRNGGHVRARIAAAAFLATLALSVTIPARAQSDDDRAAARTAATNGAKALEEGRYEEAVDLFHRAESIIHAPPHLLYMARAQVKLGRLVSARENYLKVTRETLAPTAPPAFTQAQESATAEVAQLTPRIPSLKVDVEGAPSDSVSLTIDGAAVPSAMIGLARPIDPGKHELVAKTATSSSKPTMVTLAEGETQSIKLKLVAGPGDGVASTSGTQPEVSTPTEAQPDTAKESGSSVPAFIVLGIGGVGLITGTVFMLQNRSKRGDADALCPGGSCPASHRSEVEGLDNDANKASTLSWIGYGVGVAGLAVGGVLLLTSGPKAAKPADAARARITPWVTTSSAGVAGSF